MARAHTANPTGLTRPTAAGARGTALSRCDSFLGCVDRDVAALAAINEHVADWLVPLAPDQLQRQAHEGASDKTQSGLRVFFD